MGYGGVLAAHRLKVPLILEVNGDHLREMEMLNILPRGPAASNIDPHYEACNSAGYLYSCYG